MMSYLLGQFFVAYINCGVFFFMECWWVGGRYVILIQIIPSKSTDRRMQGGVKQSKTCRLEKSLMLKLAKVIGENYSVDER